MSPFAEEPSPITLSDGQTPSSIVIIGPSNWLLTLKQPGSFHYPRGNQESNRQEMMKYQ